MLSLSELVRIYLCTQPTDMRKGFDSLATIARDWLGHDPLSGHLFVFRSRRGDRVKLLWWDKDGLVQYYKKLEAEDTQIFGFTEVGRRAHNWHVGVVEPGRMVGISRKSGPRRCVMPRQGSLSAPPRALRQREPFRSTSSGRS